MNLTPLTALTRLVPLAAEFERVASPRLIGVPSYVAGSGLRSVGRAPVVFVEGGDSTLERHATNGVLAFLDRLPTSVRDTLHSVRLLAGDDPRDAAGEQRSASGGNGRIDIWRVNDADNAIWRPGFGLNYVLDHELGHNLGSGIGPLDRNAWFAAMALDAQHLDAIAPPNTIALTADAAALRLTRGLAISRYAANRPTLDATIDEDWADSIAIVRRLGSGAMAKLDARPLRFADLYRYRLEALRSQLPAPIAVTLPLA